MGLNPNSIKLLFEAKESGVCFEKTLTLGRQSFACPQIILKELALKYGFSDRDFSWLDEDQTHYADPFFKILGARDVVAADYSDYEKASVIHDMNQPIGREYHEQWDVVFDGGTLEHVFNFPTALKNCMDMVKCGGHLIFITPINNYCGHGFYQFSPELFFRVLSNENGFSVERAILWEESGDPVFYSIHDPAEIHRRIELVSKYPVLMMVQGKKINQVDRLTTPQQSDYTKLWEHPPNAGKTRERPSKSGSVTLLKKRFLKYIFTHYPHVSKPLWRIHRWRQFQLVSLRQEPGFKRIGRLSSRDKHDRL